MQLLGARQQQQGRKGKRLVVGDGCGGLVGLDDGPFRRALGIWQSAAPARAAVWCDAKRPEGKGHPSWVGGRLAVASRLQKG
jgi:hypothetical protein